MLAYLSLLVILFVIVSAVVMQLIGAYLLEAKQNEMLEQTDQAALLIADDLREKNAQGMYERCVAASRSGGGRMLVLSTTGTVLADSYSRLNGTTVRTAEIEDILYGGKDRSYGYHKAENGEMTAYFVSAVISNGQRIGMVFRSISVRDLALRLDSLWMSILLYFFAVLVGIVLLGFVMSDFISRPINRLKAALLKATRGDFSVRTQVRGNDEIAELSRTFNMMSEKIENLDQTRNRFISNASHELKTPLSAIKVLVETVVQDEEMPREMVNDFLGDVNLEIDRLYNIVGDLLTLVSMDSGAVRLRLADASMAELADETVRRLAPLARIKGVALEFAVVEDAVIKADRMRFSQAPYNLVDNSIKYSKADGKVTVTVDREGAFGVFSVTDDGIGIPAQDLPNLFDRFYRVDKARSRTTGGTGLGLSIVRETVNLHGGEIDVESKESQGSTFTIRMPLTEENI